MALPVGNRPNWLTYFVLLLLFYLTAFSLPTRWDSEYLAVNTSQSFFDVAKIIQAISIPVCLYIFATNSVRLSRAFGAAWMWLIVMGWTFLTVLWSIDIKSSFFTAAVISIILIFSGYLSIQMDERAMTRAVAVYTLFLATLSIAMGVLTPEYGLMNSAKFAGLLRGPYSHKNLLGDVISLLLLWLLCAYAARVLRGPLMVAAIGLASVVLLWTWSTTAIIMILFCLAPIILLRSARALGMNAGTLTGLVVGFALFVMIVVPLVLDTVVGYFGKDLTFSGRDTIWQAYIALGNERPFTGFGYAAIQRSQEYGISIRFANGGRPSAHNSFIQLYVDMGFPGLFLFLVANIIVIFDGVRRVGRGDLTGIFRAVMPVGYAINGLMEGVGALYPSFGLVALFYLTMRRTPPAIARPSRTNLFGLDGRAETQVAAPLGYGVGNDGIGKDRS